MDSQASSQVAAGSSTMASHTFADDSIVSPVPGTSKSVGPLPDDSSGSLSVTPPPPPPPRKRQPVSKAKQVKGGRKKKGPTEVDTPGSADHSGSTAKGKGKGRPSSVSTPRKTSGKRTSDKPLSTSTPKAARKHGSRDAPKAGPSGVEITSKKRRGRPPKNT